MPFNPDRREPFQVPGREFWSAHVDEELKADPVGATGESLNELIAGVNRFTTDYPGEVIIWSIRYMVDLDMSKGSKEQRYWDAKTAAAFYTQLERINNCCPPNLPTSPSFDKRPFNDFMDAKQGRWCVLILTDGRLKPDIAKERVSSGIYNLPTYLPLKDFWAQEKSTRPNADKQIAELQNYKRDKQAKDQYYIMQWQCSPFAGDLTLPAPTLQYIANQETNPALYHYGLNKMTPDYFPTVILHDAVGLFHISDLSESGYNPMMQTLVIGLNLYMVSQNCFASKGRHPLLKGRAQTQPVQTQGKFLSTSAGHGAGGGFDTFRGVIFANGTVLDEVPAGFCRTCTFNDTMGADHPAAAG